MAERLREAAIESAIRSTDGVAAQHLLNVLTGATPAPAEVVSPLPDGPPALALEPRRDPLPEALEHFRPGVLSPRDMLTIVADLTVNMRAGGVSINAGFLEGLAGIILRTPLDELDALRRELLSSEELFTPVSEVRHATS